MKSCEVLSMIGQLKTENAIMLLILCGLAAQIPHAQAVWYHASTGTIIYEQSHLFTWIFSWLFALGLEFSTLMYVIHSRHFLSYVFAAISVGINLFYFQIANPDHFALMPYRYWLISFVLPLAIASYSHLCAEYANTPIKAQNLYDKLRSLLPFTQPPADYTPNEKAHPENSLNAASLQLEPTEDTPSHPDTITPSHPAPLQPEQELERQQRVIDALHAGVNTITAMSKHTGIPRSSLRRRIKGTDEYTGVVQRMIDAGAVRLEDDVYVLV